MFGGLANLEARFAMHGRTDSDRAVVTLDVEECDDRDHGGCGTSSLNRSMRRRIRANRDRGIATSANWNTTRLA